MRKTKCRKLTTYQQKCMKRLNVELMHQSIPPAPSKHPTPLHGPTPGHQHFFALDGKFPGVGTLELSISLWWGRKKRANNRPSSTLQHFLLIAQSNSAIFSILMCDFLFELTSSFVIALGFQLRPHAATTCTSLWFQY